MQNKLIARRVDFTQDTDFQVAIWGSLGKSATYISHRLGLTKCQVSYRLHKAQIKLRDYRDGNNYASDIIEDHVMMALRKAVKHQLKAITEGPKPT